MIRHCVFLRFRADVYPAEQEGIRADLAALQAVVEGFLAFGWSGNMSPEGLGRGFTHGFVIDFADSAARDRYLDHPAHTAAGQRLVAALEGGPDGLMVFDLDV